MKKIKFLAMMLLSIIVCTGFVSCGDDDDDDNGNALVGTWEAYIQEDGYVDHEVITFTADGRVTETYTEEDGYSETVSGTYTVDGNVLVISAVVDGENISVVNLFSVEGDKLTLVNDEQEVVVFTRI